MDTVQEIFLPFFKEKGLEGWMIIKIHFQRKEIIETIKEKTESMVLKKKKNYCLLGLLWHHGIILMHLFMPQPLIEYHSSLIFQNKKSHRFFLPKNCEKVASRVFSKEEIQEFVTSVQDDNWIHQTEKPIVPGLMMLAWIWGRKELSLWDNAMIFRAPAYAEEEIELYFDSYSKNYFAIVKELDFKEFDKKEKNLKLLWEIKKIR